MVAETDGRKIRSDDDFHTAISKALEFPSFYGRNLDALCDTLSTDVERPAQLIWRYSATSKIEMGGHFDKIVGLLRKIEQQYVEWNVRTGERFELVLQ